LLDGRWKFAIDVMMLIQDYVVKTISSPTDFDADTFSDRSDDEDERCDLPYAPPKTPCISGRDRMDDCDQEDCSYHIGLSNLMNKPNYLTPPNHQESAKEIKARTNRKNMAKSRYQMTTDQYELSKNNDTLAHRDKRMKFLPEERKKYLEQRQTYRQRIRQEATGIDGSREQIEAEFMAEMCKNRERGIRIEHALDSGLNYDSSSDSSNSDESDSDSTVKITRNRIKIQDESHLLCPLRALEIDNTNELNPLDEANSKRIIEEIVNERKYIYTDLVFL
jgi:hypothetical protein